MTNKTKLFLGVFLVGLGQILTFILWFDGKNIEGANGYSNIVLLYSLLFGLILIIKSFNPKRSDIYFFFMAIPCIIYFSYPKCMKIYRENKLKSKSVSTIGVVTKIGKHKYRRRPPEYYYEFEALINNKRVTKFNEDVFHIANWDLEIGDSIKIEYCIGNENILDVIGKK